MSIAKRINELIMKRKTLISISVMCLLLISLSNCNNAQTTKNTEIKNEVSEKEVIKTLKDFYTNFIKITSIQSKLDRKTLEQETEAIYNKYVTKELLDLIGKLTIDELDWDPFLESQMCDNEMLETLIFRKDSVKNDLYYASYKYGKDTVEIELVVVKEKEGFKIKSLPKLTRHLESIGYLKNSK